MDLGVRSVRLSAAASAALSVYVTDPALTGEKANDEIMAGVKGQTLTMPEGADPWEWALAIHQGADSAAEDGDHAWCKALSALASKVARLQITDQP